MGHWSVPTKIMLAGEYGVLNPGGRALALAVTPVLEVATVPTPGVTVIRLQAGPGDEPRDIVPDALDTTAPDALEPRDRLPAAVWTVAAEAGLTPDPMVVDLRWEADPIDWTPVGTSAAAAVGLALALTDGDHDAALRLAWAGHARAQGGGSGYDVAACLTGGAVVFRAGETPVPTRLQAPQWPVVERVSLSPGLRVVEAYSGRRARTRDLLARLTAARAESPVDMEAALAAHQDSSAALLDALTGGSPDAISDATDATAETLRALDARLGGVILTDEIRTLVDIARVAGVPARVSGAGGGDGVVAFARTEWLASRLRMRWIQAGFAARFVEPVETTHGGS